MKNSILMFLFFGILSAAPTCNCKNNDCIKNYRFQIPVSLSPQIDTFKIGDTIWINCEFNSDLTDLNSNSIITLENFDFKSYFVVNDIGVAPFQDANQKFTVVNEIGTMELIQLVGTTTYKINYNYNAQKYSINIALIPQEKGLFSSGFYSLLEFDDEVKILENCEESIDKIEFNLNDKANNNFELINLSADSLIKTTAKNIYDENGHYSFYVEE